MSAVFVFVPAPVALKDKLGRGEGVCKGEVNQFSDDCLYFSFYIWNMNDRNCCPTAGKVTETYRMREFRPGAGEYEMTVKGFALRGKDME